MQFEDECTRTSCQAHRPRMKIFHNTASKSNGAGAGKQILLLPPSVI